MNVDSWNKLSADQQDKLAAAFREVEGQFWDLARNNRVMRIAATPGTVQELQKFDMTLVKPSDEDKAILAEASSSAVLPTWAESCKNVEPNCVQIWNDTVGKARGFTIE